MNRTYVLKTRREDMHLRFRGFRYVDRVSIKRHSLDGSFENFLGGGAMRLSEMMPLRIILMNGISLIIYYVETVFLSRN